MLQIKLSFKWYKIRDDLIRFIFGPFEPNDIIMTSSERVEILDTTSKLNLLIPKKTFVQNFTLYLQYGQFFP